MQFQSCHKFVYISEVAVKSSCQAYGTPLSGIRHSPNSKFPISAPHQRFAITTTSYYSVCRRSIYSNL